MTGSLSMTLGGGHWGATGDGGSPEYQYGWGLTTEVHLLMATGDYTSHSEHLLAITSSSQNFVCSSGRRPRPHDPHGPLSSSHKC